jgi:hypothetical protein
MAGTLLHITLLERILKEAAISDTQKKELRDSMMDFRLGAVLFDLPYYERLLLQGLSLFSKQDVQFNEWGAKLHARSPVGLCRQLLDNATCPGSRALALGALTHAAVDTIFHPEIERRVALSAAGQTHPNRTHQFIENQMDIHIHEQLLGHPGIGTPYTREALRIAPHNGWSILLHKAIFHIHGTSPSAARIRCWLRGLRLFGALHSSPKFFWVAHKSPIDADRNHTAMRLAEEAAARSARYIETGCAYLEQSLSSRDLSTGIPDINLSTGASATPAVFSA